LRKSLEIKSVASQQRYLVLPLRPPQEYLTTFLCGLSSSPNFLPALPSSYMAFSMVAYLSGLTFIQWTPPTSFQYSRPLESHMRCLLNGSTNCACYSPPPFLHIPHMAIDTPAVCTTIFCSIGIWSMNLSNGTRHRGLGLFSKCSRYDYTTTWRFAYLVFSKRWHCHNMNRRSLLPHRGVVNIAFALHAFRASGKCSVYSGV
jgi:hypothetical protein